jgi:two-component system response regulator FixJ
MGDEIYIVDDDEAVRDSLRALFEAHGFMVYDFPSGVELLEHHVPAARGCVLLDVNLPGMDGFKVLKALSESGCRLPVILMTARTDSQTGASATEAGAAGFVQKPFVTSHLMSLVRDALNGQA